MGAVHNGQPVIVVLALYPAQAELIRRMIAQSSIPAALKAVVHVDVPEAFRQRECPIVLLSLTRSHHHRAVSFGDGPDALLLALTRARQRLMVFGDPFSASLRPNTRRCPDDKYRLEGSCSEAS